MSGQNIDFEVSLVFKNMEEYAHCLSGSPLLSKILSEIEPNVISTSVGPLD
tara:strand:+ start:289 stop:441 length:153 start_codon:yes stop_codon:yes gene_type:complete